ncbi:hypothetical protein ACFPJ1_24605 [Kribbella qitaiheensis]|uniref:hypothetical protein n=1 Tax=Kribbella qitaiheensis TaxID=1544730 RepID=UPI003623C009
MLTTAEPPGKSSEQAATIPPLLEELLRPHIAVSDALSNVDPADLAALAADIADRQAAADLDPDLLVTNVRKRMLAALSESEDFAGEVMVAATTVLDQVIKFVARRLNTRVDHEVPVQPGR